MNQDHKHLKNLIQDPERLTHFSIQADHFFYDFSKQRIDEPIFKQLVQLAGEAKAKDKFSRMISGEIINVTENRAVLHTATRDFSPDPILLNGTNVKPEIRRVNEQIKEFSLKIHTKKIKGTTGKAFTDAVVIGIGGSYLGCEFVFSALKHSITPHIDLHFLPNVDIDNFGQVIKEIDPETCLWIVISKSYTTTETMANLAQALLFLKDHHLDPAPQREAPAMTLQIRSLPLFICLILSEGDIPSVLPSAGFPSALPLAMIFSPGF